MVFKRKQSEQAQTRRRESRFADRPSTPAFSYYTRRSEHLPNTGRQTGRTEVPAESRLRSLLRYTAQRGGLLVLIAAIALFLISSISLSTTPRVVIMPEASNASLLHSTAVYQQVMHDILSSSVWNHNKLTIDTSNVSNQLESKFPELSNVSIVLPLVSHRPIVYIEPSPPAFLLHAVNGSFIVSDSGKIVLSATQLPANAHLSLPIITDQTGLQAQVHKQILTTADIQFLQIIVTELATHHIAISNLVLPKAASELDVQLTGQPYIVKFNMQPGPNDARQQAGTFIAVANKLASAHVLPSSYIDVRVDGRAYYK
ncbi:MAG TPA: hypothetical protein VFN56_00905 [Candidatus Saccharimonadales bacterium]|nr:hypothetical protein [Candidatus Saccharimonadales bacterium]